MSANNDRRKKKRKATTSLQDDASTSGCSRQSACSIAAAQDAENDKAVAPAPRDARSVHETLQCKLTSHISNSSPRISLKETAKHVLCGGALIRGTNTVFGRWWCAREPKLANFVAVQSRYGAKGSLYSALALPFAALVDESTAPELFDLAGRNSSSGAGAARSAAQQEALDGFLLRYVLATNVPPQALPAYQHFLRAYDAAWTDSRGAAAQAPFYVASFAHDRTALLRHMLCAEHRGELVDLWLWQRATRNRVAVIVLDTAYGVDRFGSIFCYDMQSVYRAPPTSFLLLVSIGARFMRVQSSDGQYLFDREALASKLPTLWLEYEQQCARGEKHSILWRAVSDFVLRERNALLLEHLPPQEQFERVAGALWGGGPCPQDLFVHVDELHRFQELVGDERNVLFRRLCAHGEEQMRLQRILCETVDAAYECGASMRRLQLRAPEGTLCNLAVAPQVHPDGDDLSNAERGKVWRLRRNSDDEERWWVLKFVETCDQVEFHRLLRCDTRARRFVVPLVFKHCAEARLWSSSGVPGAWRKVKVTEFIGAGVRRRAAVASSQEQRQQQSTHIYSVVQRGERAVMSAMERIGDRLRGKMNLVLHDNDWRAKQNRIEIDHTVLFHDFDRTVRPPVK